MQQILSDDEKCLAYIRMKPDTFKTLLKIIGPHIEKRTTNFHSSNQKFIVIIHFESENWKTGSKPYEILCPR